MVDFRALPKTLTPGAYIPVGLADLIEDRARLERRKLNEMTALLLCKALGVSPATYGLSATPGRSKRVRGGKATTKPAGRI